MNRKQVNKVWNKRTIFEVLSLDGKPDLAPCFVIKNNNELKINHNKNNLDSLVGMHKLVVKVRNKLVNFL